MINTILFLKQISPVISIVRRSLIHSRVPLYIFPTNLLRLSKLVKRIKCWYGKKWRIDHFASITLTFRNVKYSFIKLTNQTRNGFCTDTNSCRKIHYNLFCSTIRLLLIMHFTVICKFWLLTILRVIQRKSLHSCIDLKIKKKN